MSDKSKITISIGGLPTLLTVAFIVLKLCNVITWSWWWVLAPLWIPVAIVALGLLFLFIMYVFFD